MIRNKFFEDTANGYGAVKNKQRFDRVWKKILAFEESTGKSLDNGYTKEQYIALFISMEIRYANSLPNLKQYVRTYLRYLIKNGALPADQEEILNSVKTFDLGLTSERTVYFRDLDMLHDAIQSTIDDSSCYDRTVHDLPAVAMYLSWYGLTVDEIIKYKKDYVLDNCIFINNRLTVVPDHILDVFVRFRDAEGYDQQAKGVIFHTYALSEYLIRTERSQQVTPEILQNIVKRFNAIHDGGNSLKLKVVRMSGIFYRAYLRECEDGLIGLSKNPELASDVFCEDLSNGTKRARRIADYKLYKKMFGL